MTNAEQIKSKGLALGFTKVGIAHAGALKNEAEHLQEWLDKGYHATMGWMTSNYDKRVDPRMIVPNAKSVIVVAVNYYTRHPHRDAPGIGKISRYAWGDDYHDIMGERLEQFWNSIQDQFPGTEGKWYVDTGPVMEKVWAERAGVGWIGKHSNVITQDVGSWIFLGVIITTLDLDADLPATDHCGTCTLCIEACPTDAIVDPCVVDSSRCISYLTIEHRGPIEGNVVDDFEGWIYGCDICQDVCPWNEKFSVPSDEPRYEPRQGNLEPSLSDWQEMTEDEFRSRFRGSAIKRTKREGLTRNARFVLEHQSHTSKMNENTA